MNNIQINLSKAEELEEIAVVYNKAIDYLKKDEHILYTNWKYDIYPTINTAREFLEKSELFTVYVDNELSASFALNHSVPHEYTEIDWEMQLEDGEYIVLHTLAIDPDKMNCGIGKIIMAFIEGYAKSNGYKAIRLDTGSQNVPANKLYSGMRYKLLGQIAIEPDKRKNRVYNCYEKILVK